LGDDGRTGCRDALPQARRGAVARVAVFGKVHAWHQGTDGEELIDTLSEEARKGMQEKAEQGIWPTKTPLGYRNIIGPDGKKVIAVDTAVAPIVAKLFDWYASGGISLQEAAKKAGAALVYALSGAKVPVSTVHTILRNRLYTGQFEWNGKLIERQARTARLDRPVGTGSRHHGRCAL
jgi:recombinase